MNIFPFRVFFMIPEQAEERLQAGFGVSSRNFKKATDRNRIKRLIREAYRLNKQGLHDMLLKQDTKLSVFFIYAGKELPEQSLITEKMISAIERLIKRLQEAGIYPRGKSQKSS